MTVEPDSKGAPYTDLVEVPIGTFRHYMNFLVKHDLWDEATNVLRTAGIRSVVLGGAQVNIIREFVETKGAELNHDPRHAGALVVPECSIICPPPQTPHGGGTPPDGGVPDSGAPDGGAPVTTAPPQ
jgi:hypothetical protein